MKKCFKTLIFLIAIMLINHQQLHAQWQVFDPITTANAIDAWSDNRAVAAGGGQVFYTEDGGNVWNKGTIFLGAGLGGANIISISYRDSNTVFASGSLGNQNSLILKSTNGGKTYERKSVGINTELNIQAFGNDTVIAYRGFRVLRSIDNGENWINLPNNISFTSVRFLNSFVGFGFRDVSQQASEVYKTTNGGASWNFVSTLNNLWNCRIFLLDNRCILFSAQRNNQFGGSVLEFYTTTNQGQTVSLANINFDNQNIRSMERNPDGSIMAYGISIVDANLSLWKSTNEGRNWTERQAIGSLLRNFDFQTSVARTRTYLGFGGVGIHKFSSNSFEFQTIPFSNTVVSFNSSDIQFIDAQTGYYCGFNNYIIKTTNGGLTWLPKVISQSGNVTQIEFPNPSRGYALSKATDFGGFENRLSRSTDSGETWVNTSFRSLETLSEMAFFDQNNGLVCGTAGTVIKTTNGGNTWNIIQLPTTFRLTAISYATANVVLCGAEEGKIFRSVNGGDNWLPININTVQTINKITFISPTVGFLITGNPDISQRSELFKTVDGGQNWFLVSNFQFDGVILDIDFNIRAQGLGLARNFQGEQVELRYNPTTDAWSTRRINLDNVYTQIAFPDTAIAYASGFPFTGLGLTIAKNFIEPQSINLALNRTNFCTGNQAIVSFEARGFLDSTQFTLQLSNESGGFDAPTSLGTIAVPPNNPVITRTFTVLIPQSVRQGSGYRIRIVSNTPFTSGDNGQNIIIGNTPAVDAGPDTSFCAGGTTVQLRNFSPAGGRWIGNGVDSSGIFNIAATGPGIYNLTYFVAGNGCPGSDVKQVRVNNKPSFNVVSTPSLCGQSNGTAAVVQSGFSYQWSNGATSRQITGLQSGSYTVLVTDNTTGCIDSSTVLISDSGNIQVSIANLPASVCQSGANITLSANPNTGTWSGPGVAGTTFSPSQANVGANILVYNLQQSGCSFLRSDTIVVLPAPRVSAGVDRNICLGDPNPTYTGLPLGGNWAGNCITAEGSVTIPAAAGSCQAIYRFTAANGCSASDTALIFFRNLPTSPGIQANGTTLSVTDSAGFSYQWFRNGQAIAGATSSSFTVSSGGSYTVQVRNSFDCIALSQALVVTDILSIEEMAGHVVIYPNPVKDQAKVKVSQNFPNNWACFDAFGKTQHVDIMKTEEGFLMNTRFLRPGIYLLRNGNEVIRFSKE